MCATYGYNGVAGVRPWQSETGGHHFSHHNKGEMTLWPRDVTMIILVSFDIRGALTDVRHEGLREDCSPVIDQNHGSTPRLVTSSSSSIA